MANIHRLCGRLSCQEGERKRRTGICTPLGVLEVHINKFLRLTGEEQNTEHDGDQDDGSAEGCSHHHQRPSDTMSETAGSRLGQSGATGL